MALFTSTLARSSKTVGAQLRALRRHYNLSLAQVADNLSTSETLLYYLERGQFEKIPEKIYRMMLLKRYATYLGHEWEDIRRVAEREDTLYHRAAGGSDHSPIPRKSMKSSALWVHSHIVRNFIYGLFGALGVLYLAFLAYQVVVPPHLAISTPTDNYVTLEGSVLVSGNAAPDAHISINGQPVANDNHGGFRQTVILSEGLNTIKITAVKKYSQERVLTRTVYLQKKVSIRNPLKD